MKTSYNNNPKRRPKLRLPFDDKQVDMGEWAFDHKAGLCITLIAYLLFGITFMSAKIFVGAENHTQGFFIEMEDIAALEQLRDQLEEQVQAQTDFDWNSVSNRASNENSLDERVVDDRGTDASQLNNEALQAQKAMEDNRKAYEEAIAQIEAERDNAHQKENQQNQEHRDIKRQGNVTVSYSFANPTRHAQHLVVPAYQCQGGGEVVVNATLDNQGTVIDAQIAKGGDKCMQETAIKAAKASTFNIDSSAPAKHSGTISYIFIPQ